MLSYAIVLPLASYIIIDNLVVLTPTFDKIFESIIQNLLTQSQVNPTFLYLMEFMRSVLLIKEILSPTSEKGSMAKCALTLSRNSIPYTHTLYL